MLIIGLTGGIGSGKSTVADYFAELGAPIIDTDIIARELVAPEQPALNEIREEFGDEILNTDGTLNRRRLREKIFADEKQRKRLEAILHPRIRAEVKRRLAELDAPYCIVVIPLLLETGQENLVQRILAVDTPQEQQVQRTVQRDGVNAQSVENILATQVDRENRLAAADDIIYNDADLKALKEQVQKLHQRYTRLADGCQIS